MHLFFRGCRSATDARKLLRVLCKLGTWGCELPTLLFSVRSWWQSCGYRSRLGVWKRRALHNQAERLVTAETERARVGSKEAHTSNVFIAKNNVELLWDEEKDPSGEEVWDGAPNLYLGFDNYVCTQNHHEVMKVYLVYTSISWKYTFYIS